MQNGLDEHRHHTDKPELPRSTADGERWPDLLSQVGAEIAAPLTAALERVHTLTSTGKIDRRGLRALRDEIEQARQVGMIGQQLTRFASGRIHQSTEHLKLEDVLNSVLVQATRKTQARGITLEPQLKPALVVADGSLLFNLLNTTLDWALANASDRISFTIDFKTWPVNARLSCRFAHRDADHTGTDPESAAAPRLDSLAWRLIEQTAWTMGLVIDRKDAAGTTTLTFEFPRTVGDGFDSVNVSETDSGESNGASQWSNSKALAGCHVLVVASRREMRALVRDALRDMNLLIDMVATVDEAASFCREGLPHAIVVESIQFGARFTAFRDEIVGEVPNFVFIEIVEQGTVFEMAARTASGITRIGRDVVSASLPTALVFELSNPA